MAPTVEDMRATSTDYLKHWSGPTGTVEATPEGRNTRIKNYETLANNFYDISTDFYLEGWGQSFHFCRFARGIESMAWSMARHEHYIAHRLGLQEGQTVLDVGCGVGGPAKEIATFVGCKVVGLNINKYQVLKGKELAQKEGVGEEVLELVEGSFMKIPFPDATFDAVYAIEATVHASSLTDVYTEIARVLKPGGRFGVYEWVTLDSFDPSIPKHLALRSGIERGNGIACIRSSSEASQAMKDAGLTLEIAEDIGQKKDPLPWWYMVAGEYHPGQSWKDRFGIVFRMTRPGRVALDLAIRLLELAGVARPGTAQMAKEMIHGGDCIVEGGKKGLFTPMWFMVGMKPKERRG